MKTQIKKGRSPYGLRPLEKQGACYLTRFLQTATMPHQPHALVSGAQCDNDSDMRVE
jgi:hypothetical protein